VHKCGAPIGGEKIALGGAIDCRVEDPVARTTESGVVQSVGCRQHLDEIVLVCVKVETGIGFVTCRLGQCYMVSCRPSILLSNLNPYISQVFRYSNISTAGFLRVCRPQAMSRLWLSAGSFLGHRSFLAFFLTQNRNCTAVSSKPRWLSIKTLDTLGQRRATAPCFPVCPTNRLEKDQTVATSGLVHFRQEAT
jgi:hypothetical protein